jgi:hypothetical protein
MIVGIVVAVVALACAAGFLFYKRQQSPGGSTPPVQKTTKDVEMGAVEADLPAGLRHPETGAQLADPLPGQKPVEWNGPVAQVVDMQEEGPVAQVVGMQEEDDAFARIAKLNALLNAGAITQAEFDAKKTELLATI